MKRIQIILSITALALVVLMSSCSKDIDKVLVKKEGKWNITKYAVDNSTVSNSINFSVSFDASDAGTMTFNSDGSASSVITVAGVTEEGTFKWSADAAAETMTFTDFDGETFTFNVLENTKSVQRWEHNLTVTALDSTSNEDVTTTTKMNIELAR